MISRMRRPPAVPENAPLHKHRMPASLSSSIALALAMGLALLPAALPAFTLQQSFTFDSDGGCQAGYTWSVPKDAIGIIDATRGFFSPDGAPPPFPDRTALERHFSACPGMRIIACNRYESAQAVICRAVVMVPDARQAFAAGVFGGFRLSPSPKAIGDVELSARLPECAGDRRQREVIAEVIGGIDLTLTVNTPTEVIECNGRKTRFNQAQWHIAPGEFVSGVSPAVFLRW